VFFPPISRGFFTERGRSAIARVCFDSLCCRSLRERSTQVWRTPSGSFDSVAAFSTLPSCRIFEEVLGRLFPPLSCCPPVWAAIGGRPSFARIGTPLLACQLWVFELSFWCHLLPRATRTVGLFTVITRDSVVERLFIPFLPSLKASFHGRE